MADTAAAINLANGLKADRKLEMIFVNMGTGETEEWELLGRGVEDASVAFNHDTNQTTDILGITDTEVSPAKPELDLDPCTIRGGQKLSAKLLDIERRNAIAELGQFTILHVHCFLGTASAFTAEKHKMCIRDRHGKELFHRARCSVVFHLFTQHRKKHPTRPGVGHERFFGSA